jgi:Xaa-Pro aminopeptidase
MGIRIENDVWITSDGNKDLMGKTPITAGEIESLMER